MIKKIFLASFILFTIFSCSKNIIVENIIEQYEDGGRKVVHYYKEKKNGESVWVSETWFYQEGMKHLEGPIADGKRNGNFKTYYKSGALMSEGNFIDGKRDGKATVYHENGKVNYEGYYKNGKECGTWKFYDEKGILYNEVNKD
jgi:antitoxin component YwqK of YwqJK toxin-antitoxin module